MWLWVQTYFITIVLALTAPTLISIVLAFDPKVTTTRASLRIPVAFYLFGVTIDAGEHATLTRSLQLDDLASIPTNGG